jgi:hypothetical protein
MKKTPPIALALICLTGSLALAQPPAAAPPASFAGTYRGSYPLPEASTTVRVTAVVTQNGGDVRIRWTEVHVSEGAKPERPVVTQIRAAVKGSRLQFRTGGRTVFPRTRYTAILRGRDLVVRFAVYYDFDGFYTDRPGKNRQRTDREVRLVRR